MASVRASKSGLSRDTQAKINAKYDPDIAEECLEWVQDLLIDAGEESDFNIDGSSQNFHSALKDGVILAKLANALMPACIPPNKYAKSPKLAFKQMELIGLFIDRARDFGVSDHERFQTVDLFEQQNLHQVVVCLQALGRKALAKGLKGFGPKETLGNKREFSEEQLRAGKNIIGLQMGSNKGASQAGMNFGKQRHILD